LQTLLRRTAIRQYQQETNQQVSKEEYLFIWRNNQSHDEPKSRDSPMR